MSHNLHFGISFHVLQGRLLVSFLKYSQGSSQLHFPSALAAAESRRCFQHRACNIQLCHLRSDGLQGFVVDKIWIKSTACDRVQALMF